MRKIQSVLTKPLEKHNGNESVLKQIQESFFGNTLMLVSIIEGVALVIFSERAKELIDDEPHHLMTATDWGVHLPYVVISFMNIVMITYLFTSQLIYFRRSPVLYDFIFPFIIGGIQILQLHFFIDTKYWWLCMDLLFFLGTFGFYFNKNLISEFYDKNFPEEKNDLISEPLRKFNFLIVSSGVFSIAFLILVVLLFIYADGNKFQNLSSIFLIFILLSNVYTILDLNKSQKEFFALVNEKINSK